MIQIKKAVNETEWNKVLDLFKYSTLFLSWEWSEFETEMGKNIENYIVYENGEPKGLVPIKYISAKRGNYIHVRHGPLINWKEGHLVKEVMSFLRDKALASKSLFVRISPLIENSEENKFLLEKHGFKNSVIPATDAELTVVITLNEAEDEILKKMRKTTRNSIKKAQSLGVKVEKTKGTEMYEDFCKVYLDTVNRNKWNAYSLEYIKKEYEIFSRKGLANTFVSYYNGKPLSAAIFIEHRNQVIYHFSGSTNEHRDIPDTYLLHWEAIKYFKGRGFDLYNMWGVCPENSKKHPWYGLSLFKRGFSKEELEFVHSQDMDINIMAKFTHLYEFLEALRRGYK